MKIRIMEVTDYDKVYQFCLSIPGLGINNLNDSRESIDRYVDIFPTPR